MTFKDSVKVVGFALPGMYTVNIMRSIDKKRELDKVEKKTPNILDRMFFSFPGKLTLSAIADITTFSAPILVYEFSNSYVGALAAGTLWFVRNQFINRTNKDTRIYQKKIDSANEYWENLRQKYLGEPFTFRSNGADETQAREEYVDSTATVIKLLT